VALGTSVAVGTGVTVGGRVAVGGGTVAMGGRTSGVVVYAGKVAVEGSAAPVPVAVAGCSVAFEPEQAVRSMAKNNERLNVNPILRYVPGIMIRIKDPSIRYII
jgi:hypothetical protein